MGTPPPRLTSKAAAQKSAPGRASEVRCEAGTPTPELQLLARPQAAGKERRAAPGLGSEGTVTCRPALPPKV